MSAGRLPEGFKFQSLELCKQISKKEQKSLEQASKIYMQERNTPMNKNNDDALSVLELVREHIGENYHNILKKQLTKNSEDVSCENIDNMGETIAIQYSKYWRQWLLYHSGKKIGYREDLTDALLLVSSTFSSMGAMDDKARKNAHDYTVMMREHAELKRRIEGLNSLREVGNPYDPESEPMHWNGYEKYLDGVNRTVDYAIKHMRGE